MSREEISKKGTLFIDISRIVLSNMSQAGKITALETLFKLYAENLVGEDDILIGSPTDELQLHAINHRNNVRKIIRDKINLPLIIKKDWLINE